jgi:hypothetical protein
MFLKVYKINENKNLEEVLVNSSEISSCEPFDLSFLGVKLTHKVASKIHLKNGGEFIVFESLDSLERTLFKTRTILFG